jgi:peroxisomal 3,2-trans-enoyl-CoA isomerase
MLMLTQFKFNRPESLNSFGGNLIPDIIAGLRALDEHPDTVFTVLTGEGRFFSAGADVKAIGNLEGEFRNVAERKLSYLSRFSYGEFCSFFCSYDMYRWIGS